MSFLFSSGGRTPNIEELIELATAESVPLGTEDLAQSFDICDLIRSKTVAAKDAVRALKTRVLFTKNPNVQIHALKLTDLCVKNGGHTFLLELSSFDFIDPLVGLLRLPNLAQPVRILVLQYLQSWALAFQGKPELSYVNLSYDALRSEGCWNFPPLREEDKLGGKAIMIDTNSPPEWTDSESCEHCRSSFSFVTRKHHCRACGATFCQSCSSKSIPLPHYGINQDVRVCDGCFARSGKALAVGPRGDQRQLDSQQQQPYYQQYQPQPQYQNQQHQHQQQQQQQNRQQFPGYSGTTQNQSSGFQSSTSQPRDDANLARQEQEDLDLAIAMSLSDSDAALHQKRTESRPQMPLIHSSTSRTQQPTRAISTSAMTYPDVSPATSALNYHRQPVAAQPTQQQARSTTSQKFTRQATLASSTELSAIEIENVHLFAQMMSAIDLKKDPSAILMNREIPMLQQSMAALQPRLMAWLHKTLASYRELTILHNRVAEAIQLYETTLNKSLVGPCSSAVPSSYYAKSRLQHQDQDQDQQQQHQHQPHHPQQRHQHHDQHQNQHPDQRQRQQQQPPQHQDQYQQHYPQPPQGPHFPQQIQQEMRKWQQVPQFDLHSQQQNHTPSYHHPDWQQDQVQHSARHSNQNTQQHQQQQQQQKKQQQQNPPPLPGYYHPANQAQRPHHQQMTPLTEVDSAAHGDYMVGRQTPMQNLEPQFLVQDAGAYWAKTMPPQPILLPTPLGYGYHAQENDGPPHGIPAFEEQRYIRMPQGVVNPLSFVRPPPASADGGPPVQPPQANQYQNQHQSPAPEQVPVKTNGETAKGTEVQEGPREEARQNATAGLEAGCESQEPQTQPQQQAERNPSPASQDEAAVAVAVAVGPLIEF